jgi:hypothetical protein
MIWGRKSKLKRRGWGIESKVIEEYTPLGQTLLISQTLLINFLTLCNAP